MPAVPPVTVPSHFFGLEVIDLIGGGDGGMGIPVHGQLAVRREPMRRQWRSLRAGNQRGRARGKSKSEFQKMAAFHDISLFFRDE